MSDIKLKPREDLEKVLAGINKSFDFKDAHLELSSASRAKSVVKFLKEHFFPDETLSKSIGLIFDDEVFDIFFDQLSENLSILLISNTTDDIIACRTMAISRREAGPVDFSNMVNKESVEIVKFLRHRYNTKNVFDHFNVDTVVSFVAIATHGDHRGQGIASKMMHSALLFCEELGFRPVCIKGEGTSRASQRIFEKFDFETIHTMRYDEYKPDGEILFKNTGNNESTKYYVKKLSV